MPIFRRPLSRLSASSSSFEKRRDRIGYVSANFEPVFRDRAKKPRFLRFCLRNPSRLRPGSGSASCGIWLRALSRTGPEGHRCRRLPGGPPLRTSVAAHSRAGYLCECGTPVSAHRQMRRGIDQRRIKAGMTSAPTAQQNVAPATVVPDRVLSVLSAASASATGVLKRYERGGNGLGAGSGALLKGLCGPRS